MATIVEHIESGERYVFLGAGFGMFRSARPNWFLGNLAPDIDEDVTQAVCVSNVDGRVVWMHSADVRVVSIDGQAPHKLL